MQRRENEIRPYHQSGLDCHEELVGDILQIEDMHLSFLAQCSGDPFIIFSGGMPSQAEQQQTSTNTPPSKPSSFFLTILRGQTTNVLHMDNAIVDFQVISSSPYIDGS